MSDRDAAFEDCFAARFDAVRGTAYLLCGDYQMDGTATAGPRADRAVTLMEDLSSSVPPGFSTPDLKYSTVER
jgi:hypothetical protein